MQSFPFLFHHHLSHSSHLKNKFRSSLQKAIASSKPPMHATDPQTQPLQTPNHACNQSQRTWNQPRYLNWTKSSQSTSEKRKSSVCWQKVFPIWERRGEWVYVCMRHPNIHLKMFNSGVDEKCPAPKKRERNQTMQTQREPLSFLPIYIMIQSAPKCARIHSLEYARKVNKKEK